MLWIIRKIFRFLFFLLGWKYREQIPAGIDKAVMILSGHTSNWDFIFGMGSLDFFNRRAFFTIKKEWMVFPFAYFFRVAGALGIDRSKKDAHDNRISAVDQMVNLLKSMDKGYMIITPEGSRSRRDKWKSGFYHVALKAQVPIVISYIDYAKKETGLAQVLYPSGDYQKDMKIICDFYRNISVKYPEKFALDAS